VWLFFFADGGFKTLIILIFDIAFWNFGDIMKESYIANEGRPSFHGWHHPWNKH
jgi:hypothetical protein